LGSFFVTAVSSVGVGAVVVDVNGERQRATAVTEKTEHADGRSQMNAVLRVLRASVVMAVRDVTLSVARRRVPGGTG